MTRQVKGLLPLFVTILQNCLLEVWHYCAFVLLDLTVCFQLFIRAKFVILPPPPVACWDLQNRALQLMGAIPLLLKGPSF